MPRPRFERLDPDKRQRIIEAAAQEFAEHGYENASLNRILDVAGISKGAAYYYFDDKADLFATAALACWEALASQLDLDIDGLTAETFWPSIAAIYQQQFAAYHDQPWMARMMRAVGTLPPDALANSPLAGPLQEIMDLLDRLFSKGQALGVVRDDLPRDLLLELMTGIDRASDQWLLSHWDSLGPEQVEALVGQVVEIMRRVLEPPARR